MRVLVVGGTRFMGLSAVMRLVAQGHDVAVFHRGNRCVVLPPEAGHIHGDSLEISKHRGAIAGFAPDSVLHMLAVKGSDATEFVTALEGLTRRVVVASSANVYLGYSLLHGWESAEPVDRVHTEAGPLRNLRIPESNGHDEKLDVEEVVMAAEHLRPTVVRLPGVHGPNDPMHRGFEYLWKMDAGRPHILINDVFGRWRQSIGYVDNMVDALLLAMNSDAAIGRIFNVAEPEAMTHVEWVRMLGSAAGWDGKVIATPSVPLDWQVDYRHEWAIDSTAIRSELGYRESVSTREWIERTVEWLRANPPDTERMEQLRSSGLSFGEEDRIAASYRSEH